MPVPYGPVPSHSPDLPLKMPGCGETGPHIENVQSKFLQEKFMGTSNLVISVFAVLAAASLFIFIYCTWLDRHDNGSGQNQK